VNCVLATTVTVKVTSETRERLRLISAERRLTAGQVIQVGLDAIERDQQRRRAYPQAVEVARDPEDLAELRAVSEDLATTRAG